MTCTAGSWGTRRTPPVRLADLLAPVMTLRHCQDSTAERQRGGCGAQYGVATLVVGRWENELDWDRPRAALTREPECEADKNARGDDER